MEQLQCILKEKQDCFLFWDYAIMQMMKINNKEEKKHENLVKYSFCAFPEILK